MKYSWYETKGCSLTLSVLFIRFYLYTPNSCSPCSPALPMDPIAPYSLWLEWSLSLPGNFFIIFLHELSPCLNLLILFPCLGSILIFQNHFLIFKGQHWVNLFRETFLNFSSRKCFSAVISLAFIVFISHLAFTDLFFPSRFFWIFNGLSHS